MISFDESIAIATDHTFEEIGRADSKAGVVLTVDGILTTTLTGLGVLGHLTEPGIVLICVAGAALVAAMLIGLHVVRPRFAPKGVAPDRASYIYWATTTGDDEITTSLQEDRRVPRLRALSVIAHRKMRGLYWSATATAAATVALAAAVTFTAV